MKACFSSSHLHTAVLFLTLVHCVVFTLSASWVQRSSDSDVIFSNHEKITTIANWTMLPPVSLAFFCFDSQHYNGFSREKRELWCELEIHELVYDTRIFMIYIRGELYKKITNGMHVNKVSSQLLKSCLLQQQKRSVRWQIPHFKN